MIRIVCGLMSALVTSGLQAKPVPSAQVDACLRAAAAKHSIAYPLLRAIAWQESSFNPSAIRQPNTAGGDASTDYGLMQINSSWLPTLRKHGIARDHLFDPCINADVGAWILASNFAQMGVTWNAVGAYNARTQWKRVKYANGVYDKLRRLEQGGVNQRQVVVAPQTGSRQQITQHQLSANAQSQPSESKGNMVAYEAQSANEVAR